MVENLTFFNWSKPSVTRSNFTVRCVQRNIDEKLTLILDLKTFYLVRIATDSILALPRQQPRFGSSTKFIEKIAVMVLK
jgi:hypothetical protein